MTIRSAPTKRAEPTWIELWPVVHSPHAVAATAARSGTTLLVWDTARGEALYHRDFQKRPLFHREFMCGVCCARERSMAEIWAAGADEVYVIDRPGWTLKAGLHLDTHKTGSQIHGFVIDPGDRYGLIICDWPIDARGDHPLQPPGIEWPDPMEQRASCVLRIDLDSLEIDGRCYFDFMVWDVALLDDGWVAGWGTRRRRPPTPDPWIREFALAPLTAGSLPTTPLTI